MGLYGMSDGDGTGVICDEGGRKMGKDSGGGGETV